MYSSKRDIRNSLHYIILHYTYYYIIYYSMWFVSGLLVVFIQSVCVHCMEMCIKSFVRTLYGRRNDMFKSTVVCEFKNTSSIVLKNYEVMACWLISPFYCNHVFTKQCDYSMIMVRAR